MKAILLDGSRPDEVAGARVRAALEAALRAGGWDTEHFVLGEKKIGVCAGDFFCWIRTPGVCDVDDDNRAIAKAVAASDLVVYLTPVTFGGYSSVLKRMVDHQIQNLSPFFAKVQGETHHEQRYAKYPDVLAVGWLDAPDARAEAVFRNLVRRNAINFFAAKSFSAVVLAGQSDADLRASAQHWLDALQGNRLVPAAALPADGGRRGSAPSVRRALLLVGSPKTRNSTSHVLGTYLFERLRARSIDTTTTYLHTVVHSPGKMTALLNAVDHADLVTLAFPLYVDSLPAPVIEVLEGAAAHRRHRGQTEPQLFAAIANCGFPEVHHMDNALAICEMFARQAKFAWASSLALGGGQGLVNGMPLAELGGRAAPLRNALELAADALARGQAIPNAAQDLIAKPVIPGWLYRLAGGYGWRQEAKRYGAQKSLRRRPYASDAVSP